MIYFYGALLHPGIWTLIRWLGGIPVAVVVVDIVAADHLSHKPISFIFVWKYRSRAFAQR